MNGQTQSIAYNLLQTIRRPISAFLFLTVIALTGCNAPSIGAHSATATPADGNGSTGISAASASTPPLNVPWFSSAAALTTMQKWNSEVASGSISDGSSVHTLANSGWRVSPEHIDQYAPYGASAPFTQKVIDTTTHLFKPDPGKQFVSIVGNILYVFAWRPSQSSSSAPISYGMLLGTVNSSHQPVTLLMWVTPDTGILFDVTAQWTGMSFYSVTGTATDTFSDSAYVAMILANRLNLGRTVVARVMTSYDKAVAGSPDTATEQPAEIAHTNALLALMSQSGGAQSNTGVFSSLPPSGFSITAQEGFIPVERVSLPLLPQHHSFSF